MRTARSSPRTSSPRNGAAPPTTPLGARELIAEDEDDPELRDLLRTSEERLAELEEEIRLAMVEPDPNDDKDVIVEIRPGAGESRGCSRPTSTACSTAMPTAVASRPSRSRWAAATSRSP